MKRTVEKLRLLLVEDNDDSRTIMQKLLQLEGRDVTVAAEGKSGFEALRRERFDVVLLDIGLPGMDGYELARRARAEIRDRPLRLVALTGYGRAEDHKAILEAGFDEHLVKPVNPALLFGVLRGSLTRGEIVVGGVSDADDAHRCALSAKLRTKSRSEIAIAPTQDGSAKYHERCMSKNRAGAGAGRRPPFRGKAMRLSCPCVLVFRSVEFSPRRAHAHPSWRMPGLSSR